MFACRMARAVTRREKVLKFEGGWHGFHDYAMVGNWRVPSEAPYPYPGPRHRRHPPGRPGQRAGRALQRSRDDRAHRHRAAPRARRDHRRAAPALHPPAARLPRRPPRARPSPRRAPHLRRGRDRLPARLRRRPGVLRRRARPRGLREGADLRVLAGGDRGPGRRHGHGRSRAEGDARLRRALGHAARQRPRVRGGASRPWASSGARASTSDSTRWASACEAESRGGPDRLGSAGPGRSRTARSRRSSSSLPRPTSPPSAPSAPPTARRATRFGLECLRRGIFTIPEHEALPLPRAHGRRHRLDARRHGRGAAAPSPDATGWHADGAGGPDRRAEPLLMRLRAAPVEYSPLAWPRDLGLGSVAVKQGGCIESAARSRARLEPPESRAARARRRPHPARPDGRRARLLGRHDLGPRRPARPARRRRTPTTRPAPSRAARTRCTSSRIALAAWLLAATRRAARRRSACSSCRTATRSSPRSSSPRSTSSPAAA